MMTSKAPHCAFCPTMTSIVSSCTAQAPGRILRMRSLPLPPPTFDKGCDIDGFGRRLGC
jgi:hypothetical protein